jgi:hypothetical protein
VADLVDRIGQLPLPDVARDWPETRWDRFASEADASLFTGDTLLYTDIHASDILVGTSGVWAVDWAWPTRDAALAILVAQLVAAGHPPADAEGRASRCAACPPPESALAASHASRHLAPVGITSRVCTPAPRRRLASLDGRQRGARFAGGLGRIRDAHRTARVVPQAAG